MNNPYTNINVVLATRRNWSEFASGFKPSKSDKAFMLGLPADYTGRDKKDIYVSEGWRWQLNAVKDKVDDFKGHLSDHIKEKVFGKPVPAGITDPYGQIWNYATGEESGFDNITDDGKKWIDKHICPYKDWNDTDKSRRADGKFCKYTCTEESIEHFAFVGDPKTSNSIYYLPIMQLFSSLSARLNLDTVEIPDDNFVLTKEPTSYVTIEYHNGKNGPVTGSLKIIVIDEPISENRADTHIYADNAGLLESRGAILDKIDDSKSKFKGVYWTILQTNTSDYPVVWKDALKGLS